MKKIILSLLVLSFLIIPLISDARSGCCSWHGGVCGCGCCDGTSLSTTCAPYYPECNSSYTPSIKDYFYNGSQYVPISEIINNSIICPPNATQKGIRMCICDNGYSNKDNLCVLTPATTPSTTPSYSDIVSKLLTPTCSLNAYLGTNNKCYCNTGYLNINGQCITYNQNCQNSYGVNSYGDINYCYCNTGYVWNTDKTLCVKNAVVDNSALIQQLLAQIADLQRQINEILAKRK